MHAAIDKFHAVFGMNRAVRYDASPFGQFGNGVDVMRIVRNVQGNPLAPW